MAYEQHGAIFDYWTDSNGTVIASKLELAQCSTKSTEAEFRERYKWGVKHTCNSWYTYIFITEAKSFLLPSFFTPFGFISFIAFSPLSCLIFEICGFSLTRFSSLFHPGFAWWDACQQIMPRVFSSATSVLRLLSISTLLSYPLGKTFALFFCISAHQPRLVIQLQLSNLARESDRIFSSILAVHHICNRPDDGYWYCNHFDRGHSGVRCHKLQYRDADTSADNRYNDSSSVSNRPNKFFLQV
jgi:hypothetical protein